MEKLIELLNKFERETFPEEHEYVRFPDGTDDDGGYWYYEEDPSLGEQEGFNYTSRGDKRNSELNQLLIISKEFGFIKWLVENDKIDLDKLKFQSDFMFPLWKDFDQMGSEDIEEYSDYESLLMLLSISDTPIEDLCGYLKDDNEELRIEREFQKGNTIFPM